jgi:hypothetical protein
MRNKGLVAPVLVIVLGITWLLNVMHVMPGVDWMWTGGLAAAGVLTLVASRINRLSVVVGPFLIAASVCSLLRQVGTLPVDREVPILTIILGILMLVANLARLPSSEGFRSDTAA